MKVGVLGAGAMGGTVIEHLQHCAGVTEVLAQDIREARVAELRERYGIAATTDVRDILDDPQVPLVFVTSSNDAHKSLVLQALATGKAVMCEKPMANSLADARAMVEESERRGAFLQIGFELRYSKLYTTVKEWIDAGLLGDIINTHCYYICSEFHGKGSWRNKKATGGSMFGEKLSHYVDLPRWWIGADVQDVFTVCAPNVIPYYEVRDNYHTTYRFANGAVSHLTFMMAVGATFHGDPLQDVVSQQQGDGHALRFLVVGTKGAAETDVFARTIKRWEFGDSPKNFTSNWVENITWEPKEDHHFFHSTYDQTFDIVDRVAHGLPPKTSARDAYETMKLCFAAEESADTGRLITMDALATVDGRKG
ncbi:MAG TPA: Gfo/Idh/MocA family oxidoreductase [Armatimonadota bacterium]|jgi:predicted dehydrogenase